VESRIKFVLISVADICRLNDRPIHRHKSY
jgi:hypothetical protein